jgi:hypothetical protein
MAYQYLPYETEHLPDLCITNPKLGKNVMQEGHRMAIELKKWNRDIVDEQVDSYEDLLERTKFCMRLQDDYGQTSGSAADIV